MSNFLRATFSMIFLNPEPATCEVVQKLSHVKHGLIRSGPRQHLLIVM